MNLKLVDPIAKIEKDIRVALIKDLNKFLISITFLIKNYLYLNYLYGIAN